MVDICWCLKQKDGISLIEPNKNLSFAYIKKAEESLCSMREVTSKDWQISASYYSLYFSMYSVFMRVGIKCEIHSCTIECANEFFSSFFSERDIDFLRKSLQARIDSQYYIDRTVLDEQFLKMQKDNPVFLVKCKNILNLVDETKIINIRNSVLSKTKTCREIEANKTQKEITAVKNDIGSNFH